MQSIRTANKIFFMIKIILCLSFDKLNADEFKMMGEKYANYLEMLLKMV